MPTHDLLRIRASCHGSLAHRNIDAKTASELLVFADCGQARSLELSSRLQTCCSSGAEGAQLLGDEPHPQGKGCHHVMEPFSLRLPSRRIQCHQRPLARVVIRAVVDDIHPTADDDRLAKAPDGLCWYPLPELLSVG